MRMVSLAARNLSRNRRRTLITLAALVLGVAAMVALRGFINGQRHNMVANVAHGSVGAIQVHKKGYLENVLSSPLTLDMEDSAELRQKMASVSGVTAVAGRLMFGAMFSTPDLGAVPGKTSFLMLTGLEPKVEPVVTPRRMEWMNEGQFFLQPEGAELVINVAFGEGAGAKVDDVSSPLPEEQWPALLANDRDGSLNGLPVQVVGTIHNGAPGDKRYGFTTLAHAQQLLRMEGRVTEYAIAVEQLDDVHRVRDEIAAALGPEYEVHSYDQVVPFLVELWSTSDFLFDIVSAIFLLVVLLGIVNAMLMSVLERVREIGTMLAVGLRRRQIVGLFLLEGLVLGALGGALGALVGFGITAWLHHRGIPLHAPGAAIPSIVRPDVTVLYTLRTLAMATVGSMLAAMWPAYRASALRPVEALQSL